MKKLIVFLSFLSLVACSNDGGDNKVMDYTYNASIRDVCGSGPIKTYEVTETTYNNLEEYILAGGACQQVKFKDTKRVYHTGYLSGIGKTN